MGLIVQRVHALETARFITNPTICVKPHREDWIRENVGMGGISPGAPPVQCRWLGACSQNSQLLDKTEICVKQHKGDLFSSKRGCRGRAFYYLYQSKYYEYLHNTTQMQYLDTLEYLLLVPTHIILSCDTTSYSLKIKDNIRKIVCMYTPTYLPMVLCCGCDMTRPTARPTARSLCECRHVAKLLLVWLMVPNPNL